MVLKNIIISIRHIKNNWFYSSLNIIGLSIALTVYILSTLIFNYQHNYDSFFKNSDRIYAVYTKFDANDFGTGVVRDSILGILPGMMPFLEQHVIEAEETARFYSYEFSLKVGNEEEVKTVRFASSSFFKIFDFDFIHGSADNALIDPDSIVITQSVAQRYFPDKNPINEIITLGDNHKLKITAVIKDLPSNSLFSKGRKFDIDYIASPKALQSAIFSDSNNLNSSPGLDNWWWALDQKQQMFYVLMPDNNSVEKVISRFPKLVERYVPEKTRNFLLSGMGLYQLKELALSSERASGANYTNMIRAVGIIVLIIASINFINLSTVMLTSRNTEIAVRKLSGANRYQLIVQFLMESVALTFIALFVAILLVKLMIPFINSFDVYIFNSNIKFELFDDFSLLSGLVILVVFVGVSGGSYPALLMSGLNPVGIFNNVPVYGGLLKKTLIFIQFFVAIFMVIIALTIYLQHRHVIGNSEKYTNDQNVLVIDTKRMLRFYKSLNRDVLQRKIKVFVSDLQGEAGVENAAVSSSIPSLYGLSYESKYSRAGNFGALPVSMSSRYIDNEYLDVYENKLLSGRGFSSDRADIPSVQPKGVLEENVLISNFAAKRLGWAHPENAVNELLYMDYSEKISRDKSETIEQFQIRKNIREQLSEQSYRIIGVVEDVRYIGASPIIPTIFFNSAIPLYISIRLEDGDQERTIESIDELWDRHFNGIKIERYLLSEKFRSELIWLDLWSFSVLSIALLCVLIVILGLVGLTGSLTAKRAKEVAVRKLLGAPVYSIIYLFIKDFTKLVLFPCAVASPLAYYFVSEYLKSYSDKVEISANLFLLVNGLALIVTWVTVITCSAKVAMSKPVNYLNYE